MINYDNKFRFHFIGDQVNMCTLQEIGPEELRKLISNAFSVLPVTPGVNMGIYANQEPVILRVQGS
jgi:hypothetical protein